MQRDQAIASIQSHAADYSRFGVASLRLFGSTARDEAKEDSDVDVMVEFKESPTFRGFMGLKLFLEDEVLHRAVDLVIPEDMPPVVRLYAEREAIRVA